MLLVNALKNVGTIMSPPPPIQSAELLFKRCSVLLVRGILPKKSYKELQSTTGILLLGKTTILLQKYFDHTCR